jgi:hypothetical protein
MRDEKRKAQGKVVEIIMPGIPKAAIGTSAKMGLFVSD